MAKTNWDPLLAINEPVIGFYDRAYYCFSNFSAFAIRDWRGILWMTSEHLYQAEKFALTAPEIFLRIMNAPSPHDAKKIAHQYESEVAKNWDEIKVPTMLRILTCKLTQHPYVQKTLLGTDNLLIVEDSPFDGFWGWGADRLGQNMLGRLWMQLREELRNNPGKFIIASN